MKSRANHLEKRHLPALPCMRMIALLLVACAAGPTGAEEAGTVKTRKSTGGEQKPAIGKDAEEPAGASAADSGLKAFGQMIPLGSRSRGVRIPAFDKGKPSSLIVADAMTRVDDNRLFGEKLVIQVFAENKDEDMRIDMKTGTYNMDHQILSSTERSRVSRSDFQIEGDGMVFDTKTSQGKMVGNVEMIIFDARSASQKMNIQTGGRSAADPKKSPDSGKPGNPVDKK